MPETQEPAAIDVLSSLLGDPGFLNNDLSAAHDLLKLVGVVLAQHALLDITTNAKADDKARVSAARALLAIKESPAAIAERLRRSPFAHLSAEELSAMIRQVRQGKTSLRGLLEQLNGSNIQTEGTSDGSQASI